MDTAARRWILVHPRRRQDIPLPGRRSEDPNHGGGLPGVYRRPDQHRNKGKTTEHRGGGLAHHRGRRGRRAHARGLRGLGHHPSLPGGVRQKGGYRLFERGVDPLLAPESPAPKGTVETVLPGSTGPGDLQGGAYSDARVGPGAHERELRVDVWTIDDEPDMRRLLGFGVDGIMTDRPDILAKVLRGE